MLRSQIAAPAGQLLSEEAIRQALTTGLTGHYASARVLVLIPDHTRTLPLPRLFPMVVEALADTKQLDFMVALGTHPALDEASLNKLVGITAELRTTTYKHVGIFNHAWDDSGQLAQIGTITQAQVKELAGDAWHPSLGGDMPVKINRAVMDYDHVIVLGPTFPHEVVGFSGGAKYLFPGISGPELINVTHWMGALITILETIGIRDTPMRATIHTAARMVPTPVDLVGLVVEKDGLSGLFVGPLLETWEASVTLSSQRHITSVDRPFQQVLSVTPPMYDELWTGAKAMYKMEPAIADGGEVIVYAPHLDVVSHVHGKYIYRAGYHVRDYFLKQWEQFMDIPLGVLAHSTHLRGSGVFENGEERARIKVTLASKLTPEDCARLSLGYLNPDEIDLRTYQNRESEGILFVPKAGEMLYRVRHNSHIGTEEQR
jgi:nickel-dependent lactate racemase